MTSDFAYLATNSKDKICLFGGSGILPVGQNRVMQANRIRELRKSKSMTLEALSEKTGISTAYLNRLESGKRNLSVQNIEKIAEALAVTARAIINEARVISPAGSEPSDVEKVSEGWPDLGDDWIDVRGVTVGGDDSFFYMGDAIDQVRRPPGLRNAKNVACLNVAGESMFPRFKPGELIYVQQRLAAPGDDVVVELHPEHEGETPKSFLKELVRRTGARLYCRQHNPAADIEFNMAEVKTVWRVLTLRDLMG